MARERVQWADAARGIAISLVVLHHAMRRSYWQGGSELWEQVTEMVATVRMPLFFLVAGLFAVPWLTERSWRRLVDAKVLLFAWVFVVWLVLRYLWFVAQPNSPAQETAPPAEMALRLPSPAGGWFIYALALLFVIGKAASAVPAAVQLGVAATFSILWTSGTLGFGNQGWDGVASYAFFFLAGALLRPLWLTSATWLTGLRGPAVIGAWVLCYVVCASLGMTDWLGISFGLRLLGAAAGIALAVALQRRGSLRAVGRGTLPVYVVHPLLIISAVRFLDRLHPLDDGIWGLTAPFLIGIPVLVVTYFLGRLAPRIGLGWLFDKPRWLTIREPEPATADPVRTR